MLATHLLHEALKPSQYRKYVKKWDKERYQDIFTDSKYEHDRKGFRVFLPIRQIEQKPKVSPKIVRMLKDFGYQVDDYIKGIAQKIDDPKRKIKIGKILNKDPELQKLFVNDPQRKATKNEYEAVISRHPYDIAGMSTDRGWRSCMNLKDGEYKRYVKQDIKYGTVIAYAVRKGDRNIDNPVARVLIKPFLEINYEKKKKDLSVLFGVEDRIYGEEPAGFREAVLGWVDQVNNRKALNNVTGMELHKSLYQDSEGRRTHIKNPSKLDDDEKEDIIDHDPMAIRFFKKPPQWLQLRAVGHEGFAIELIKNPSRKVQKAAVENNGYAIKYIQNPTESIIMAALENEPDAAEYVPPHLLTYRIQKQLIEDDHRFIASLPNPDPRVVLLAIEYGDAPEYADYIENPSPKLQVAMVSTHPATIDYIKDPVKRAQIIAVKLDIEMIEYIEEPCEEAQLIAVKESPDLIVYISDPTEKVQFTAVSQDGDMILQISDPSEKVQIAAVKNDYNSIVHIDEPTENTMMAAFKYGFDKDGPRAVSDIYWAIYDRIGDFDNPTRRVKMAFKKYTGEALK